jgi:hypothetical protein
MRRRGSVPIAESMSANLATWSGLQVEGFIVRDLQNYGSVSRKKFITKTRGLNACSRLDIVSEEPGVYAKTDVAHLQGMDGHVHFLVDSRLSVPHGLCTANFGGASPFRDDGLLPFQRQIPLKTNRR